MNVKRDFLKILISIIFTYSIEVTIIMVLTKCDCLQVIVLFVVWSWVNSHSYWNLVGIIGVLWVLKCWVAGSLALKVPYWWFDDLHALSGRRMSLLKVAPKYVIVVSKTLMMVHMDDLWSQWGGSNNRISSTISSRAIWGSAQPLGDICHLWALWQPEGQTDGRNHSHTPRARHSCP